MTLITTVALKDAEIADCLQIRRTVFVEGQGILEDVDIDGKDDECVHFLTKLDGQAIATLRIIPRRSCAVIQRVAVLPQQQSCGIGKIIMKQALEWLQECGYADVSLSAQVTVTAFYQKLGFQTVGSVYEKAGIEHQDMELSFQ